MRESARQCDGVIVPFMASKKKNFFLNPQYLRALFQIHKVVINRGQTPAVLEHDADLWSWRRGAGGVTASTRDVTLGRREVFGPTAAGGKWSAARVIIAGCVYSHCRRAAAQ